MSLEQRKLELSDFVYRLNWSSISFGMISYLLMCVVSHVTLLKILVPITSLKSVKLRTITFLC